MKSTSFETTMTSSIFDENSFIISKTITKQLMNNNHRLLSMGFMVRDNTRFIGTDNYYTAINNKIMVAKGIID